MKIIKQIMFAVAVILGIDFIIVGFINNTSWHFLYAFIGGGLIGFTMSIIANKIFN